MVIILQIINVNTSHLSQIKKFLNTLSSLTDLDEDILPNGIAIASGEEIKGFITYEKFCEYGLIRYFIFQRTLSNNIVSEMFLSLVGKAKNDDIESFISIGKSDEVISLFNLLDFYEIDSDNFLINGQNLKGTELEDAMVLKYDIQQTN